MKQGQSRLRRCENLLAQAGSCAVIAVMADERAIHQHHQCFHEIYSLCLSCGAI